MRVTVTPPNLDQSNTTLQRDGKRGSRRSSKVNQRTQEQQRVTQANILGCNTHNDQISKVLKPKNQIVGHQLRKPKGACALIAEQRSEIIDEVNRLIKASGKTFDQLFFSGHQEILSLWNQLKKLK
jgi:hypothetical protein